MSKISYDWNEVINKLNKQNEMFTKRNSLSELTVEQQLKIANSKLASIELIMDEYYTGSFTSIGELAGEISSVLIEDEDEV